MKNRHRPKHGKPKRQPLGEFENVQPQIMPTSRSQMVKRPLNESPTEEGLRTSKRSKPVFFDYRLYVSLIEQFEEGSAISIPVQALTQQEAENSSSQTPRSATQRGVERGLSEFSSRSPSPEQLEEDVESDWSESSFSSRTASPEQPEKEVESSLSEISPHSSSDDQPGDSPTSILPPAEITHRGVEPSLSEPSSPTSPPEQPEVSVCLNPPLSEPLPVSRSYSAKYNSGLAEPVGKEDQGHTESLLLNLPTEVIDMIIKQSQGPLEYLNFASTCKTLLEITSRCLPGLSLDKSTEAYNNIILNLRHRFGTDFLSCCYAVMRYRKLWRNMVLRKNTDSLDTESWRNSDLIPLRKVQNFNKEQFLEPPVLVPEACWGGKLLRQDYYLMSTVLHQAEIVVKELSKTAFQNTAAFENLGYRHHDYDESSPVVVVLTQDERSRFLNAVLQYEYYCCLFFYKGNVVFENETKRHEGFFDNRNYSGLSEILGFYSVVMCVYTFYYDLIQTMRYTAFNNTTVEKVMYFRLADWTKVLRFVHFLLCQGIHLFAKVYVMDSHRRMEFLLGEFFEHKDNKIYPVIDVWGRDSNGDTHGETIWTPWAYSDKVLGPTERLFLRSAFALWDSERLDKMKSTVAIRPRC
ncbi:hypothetical protein FVEN_g972 [Fusarium venenatum]|nr:hypothetical protein FVEN_g972 [Fusarium venenatum]